MIADPQIETLWEFGLFMLAPVALAAMVGQLLRWRDRHLQQECGPQRSTFLRAGSPPPLLERVEGIPDVDCTGHQGSLHPKVVA
jgi:hypothetical protein